MRVCVCMCIWCASATPSDHMPVYRFVELKKDTVSDRSMEHTIAEHVVDLHRVCGWKGKDEGRASVQCVLREAAQIHTPQTHTSGHVVYVVLL